MAHRAKFLEDVTKMLEDAKHMPQDEKLFTYNGVLYPSMTCSLETFQALESFEARENDVLLVSYPKCGSNWTLKLLQDMVQAAYKQDPSSFFPAIEFKEPEKFEMLVVFRNPKDTAVSLFHFYNNNSLLPKYNSWDTFFQDYIHGNVIWGSYFDHAVAWNNHIDDEGVCVITFEEMKQDLEASVKKISDFFGFPLTQEQVQQIANNGTFKSMNEKSKETHGDFGKVLFRKGEVGDWKNHFSEAQSQTVDAKFENCLAGTKLGKMLNYNVYCK
ncbi:sulfotransferase 6B1-like isoform 2-T2 [Discoglossus pictus]